MFRNCSFFLAISCEFRPPSPLTDLQISFYAAYHVPFLMLWTFRINSLSNDLCPNLSDTRFPPSPSCCLPVCLGRCFRYSQLSRSRSFFSFTPRSQTLRNTSLYSLFYPVLSKCCVCFRVFPPLGILLSLAIASLSAPSLKRVLMFVILFFDGQYQRLFILFGSLNSMFLGLPLYSRTLILDRASSFSFFDCLCHILPSPCASP